MGRGTRSYYAHDAQRQPDGTLTVFDNRGAEFDKRYGPTSHVRRIRLDYRRNQARLVESWRPPNGNVISTSQGNARILEGGPIHTGSSGSRKPGTWGGGTYPPT